LSDIEPTATKPHTARIDNHPPPTNPKPSKIHSKNS
jgi:hypothetical protein